MPRLPLRALASALGTSLVLFALVPLFGAGAQQGGATQDDHAAPLASGMTHQHFSGTTVLHLQGVCPERSPCVGGNESESDRFFLGAGGEAGRIVVTWRAVDDSVSTLRVRVAGLVAEGWSPLTLEVDGLRAGAYRVDVEPVGRVAGLVEQEVRWTASFYVPDAPLSTRIDGVSAFRTTAACAAPLGCDPLVDQESAAFILPWSGDGHLEATWTVNSPFARELRVTIAGTTLAAQGESPLRLDVRGLAPGEYRVDVEPVTAPPGVGQSVSWTLVAARAS